MICGLEIAGEPYCLRCARIDFGSFDLDDRFGPDGSLVPIRLRGGIEAETLTVVDSTGRYCSCCSIPIALAEASGS
jgi:hypothetical protein